MIIKMERYIEINLAKKFDSEGRVIDVELAYIAADAENKKRNFLAKQNFGEDINNWQNESLRKNEWLSYNPRRIERRHEPKINKRTIDYLGDVAATQAIKDQLHYESDLLNIKINKHDMYGTLRRKQASSKLINRRQKLDKDIEGYVSQVPYPEEASEEHPITIV